MQFVFVKKPVVQIKPTSTGKLTRSEILVLAFLYSKANRGRGKTTYIEISRNLKISQTTIYESIRDLLRARLILIHT